MKKTTLLFLVFALSGCATTYPTRYAIIHYDQATHRDLVLDTHGKRVWECEHQRGQAPHPDDKSCKPMPYEQFYGEIHIKTDPPRAAVFLDGTDIKIQTPIIVDRVPRDQSHTLVLKLHGYKEWQQTFDLKDQSTHTYDVQLERQ